MNSDNYIFTPTVKGIQRVCKSTRRERHPLSPLDIIAMHRNVNTMLPFDFTFWSSLVFAYRCALRVGHVTKSVHNIKAGDVVCGDGFLIVTIRSSKTDQLGKSPHVITINESPDSLLCPVYFVKEILRIQKPKASDPLFRISTIDGYKPISYSAFNSRLKDLAVAIGLDESIVSSHSVRHGAATFLQAAGLSSEEIKFKCNWKSSVVFRYLHPTVLQKLKKDLQVSEFLSLFT